MSDYYRPTRSRNLFSPKSDKPFRLSRSKLELFVECQRCFYLDRRLGINRPPSFPFNLNSAVDTLLKKEFDIYREEGAPHPLMTENGILAKPFKHEKIEEWRDALRRGIAYHHSLTNLIISGGVDDVWINDREELIIVDYKSTSKEDRVNIDAEWQGGYKRQMEIYQWLFRNNGFKVSRMGYFVYCNGQTSRNRFDARLEFDISLIPYVGDDSWVDGVITKAHAVLSSDSIPAASKKCDFCLYHQTLLAMETGDRSLDVELW